MTAVLDIPAIYQPRNQQRTFRLLLDAMARPGTLADLTPWTGGRAAHLAVLATLCDGEVSLADPDGLVDMDAWRFLECRRGVADNARFIVAQGSSAPPQDLAPMLGTLATPELGATLVLAVTGLGQLGLRAHLSGPGIAGTADVRLGTLHGAWLERRGEWNRFFPMGVDIVLADRHRIMALPRTTRIVQVEVRP